MFGGQTLLRRAGVQKPALMMTQYAKCYFSAGSLRSKLLVETGEVEELIAQGSPSLRLINASWYLPTSDVDAKKQHEEYRLTRETQYFDIKTVADVNSGLPNTMPSVEMFKEHMERMRIGKDCEIVCYDHVGMFSVARCAWMLRYFGAGNVRIMNGGLQKWLKEGRAVYSGAYTPGEGLPADADYSSWAAHDPSLVITDIKEVHEIVRKLHHGDGTWQIVDARPAARFNGELPEPRDTRAGRISHSLNLPFGELVDKESGCMKSDEELRSLFESKAIDLGKTTVHSCGSGVTSCINSLAWELAGGAKTTMYDGSWSEYGRVDEPDFTKA